MCSMPAEASENESGSCESKEDGEGLLFRHAGAVAATFSAAFFGTIIVSIIISRMWDEDEIKLHMLDFIIRVLQSVARLCGGWAIQCENAYNEHVNALH